MLDESEPLAGLLRKCLLLGAETGSVSLREWARKELNGYGDEDGVPRYRMISAAISVDSQSGPTWVQGQIVDPLQMPAKARKYLSSAMPARQPVEELAELATRKELAFTNSGLAYAQSVWNGSLGPFQAIINMRYVTTGSAVAGIIGQIRTQLVDLIADLTAETPLTELPRKELVDAAVSNHIGQARDVYNTTIHGAGGPVAIGGKATATEGLSIEGAVRLLEKVHEVAGDVDAGRRSELLDAVSELREAVERDAPDTGDVVKKAGRLRRVGDTVGVPSVSAAVGGAIEAITTLAMNGALG